MPKRLGVAHSGMLAYRSDPSDQGNHIAGFDASKTPDFGQFQTAR